MLHVFVYVHVYVHACVCVCVVTEIARHKIYAKLHVHEERKDSDGLVQFTVGSITQWMIYCQWCMRTCVSVCPHMCMYFCTCVCCNAVMAIACINCHWSNDHTSIVSQVKLNKNDELKKS